MGVRRIDAERAKELLESTDGYVFVDVRTEQEFDDGHVPTAQNVPIFRRGAGGIGLHMNDEFRNVMESRFQKTEKIILGCQKGGRSAKAAEILADGGFTNVFDMRGGFIGETDPFGTVTFPGWTTRGFPSTTDCKSGDRYRHVEPEGKDQPALVGGRKRR